MRFVVGALGRIVATSVADVMGEEPKMQRNLSTADRGLRATVLGLALISALVISGCGPLGDDDSDPTSTAETIAQPTTVMEATSSATPAVETPEESPAQSTPARSLATPGEDGATPISTDQGLTGEPGTPVAFDGVASNATPESVSGGESESSEPDFTGSDGTSGATPEFDPGDGGPGEADSTPASDGEFFVEIVATPDENSIFGMSPVEVSSCDPESVPELAAEQPEFITVVNVNFRVGPGADCDQIGDVPIAVNVPVTVLSGPVVREDDEAFTWVQVQVDDQTGWIVIEAIEPAS